MVYSNNPHTVYNGFISGQRNMFLSSSLSIIMIGFSDTFKNKTVQLSVKICGLVILMLAVFIGITATHDFRFYITHNKDALPGYIPIDSWKSWAYVTYIYCFILICLACLFLFRKIIKF